MTDLHHIATFYEFLPLADPAGARARIEQVARRHGILGTVLLADEGVNGTLAGGAEELDLVLEAVRDVTGAGLRRLHRSRSPSAPFRRLRVRVRPEIVTFRRNDADPGRRTGIHLGAEEWDALLARDDVRLVDTRNDYEVAVGSFSGAENPGTDNFTDFVDWAEQHLDPARDRKIAMYCTGGIRCEKASSYLLGRGFREVFQLDGGILGYLSTGGRETSRWKGECYVFDERVTVDGELRPGSLRNCAACGWPVPTTSPCPRCDGGRNEAGARHDPRDDPSDDPSDGGSP